MTLAKTPAGGPAGVLAFVLAHNAGDLLQPLTADRCKPAVPFEGKHLLIDFVLSNLVNSGIYSIYVLADEKSQSLIEHVRSAWCLAPGGHNGFVTVMPPQRLCRQAEGTALALHQHAQLIRDFQPGAVAVFGGDHIFRMDVRQMLGHHHAMRAHVTVATLPIELSSSHRFGVTEIADDGRITDFQENPPSASPMPGSATHVRASMGNYLFDPDVLLGALARAVRTPGADFGRDVLPAMVQSHRLMAYDFTSNQVPGVADFEETAYWRDVSAIDSYFEAQFDTVGCRPRFRLANRHWPIQSTTESGDPVQIENAAIHRSMIGPGCLIDGAKLDHALVRHSVTIHRGAVLEHCIVMERSVVGAGACIRRTIIDSDNVIPANEKIGFDAEHDRERFHVTNTGVVVVPAGHFQAQAIGVPGCGSVRPAGLPMSGARSAVSISPAP